jgi:hypothetical protein
MVLVVGLIMTKKPRIKSVNEPYSTIPLQLFSAGKQSIGCKRKIIKEIGDSKIVSTCIALI